MIRRFRNSLRFKLTMLLMIMMTLTVFVSLGVIQLSIKSFFLGELRNRMVNMYQDINIVFSQKGLSNDEILEHLSKLAANGEINVYVRRPDGYAFSNANEDSKMWDSLEAIAYLLKVKEESPENIFDFGDKGYYIFHQNFDKKLNATFYDLTGELDDGSLIALRTSASRFNASISAAMHLYIYVGILATAIGCIAMFFVSSSYVKPIHEMAAVAKRMAHLDFGAKVERHSDDEIGELGDSINSLSSELEATISELKSANAELMKDIEKKNQIDEMRREFLSHVSHELKTPIALIQGYAEGLQENILDDAESKNFYCEVIMDEADRMNIMVKKLLALNELEFGTNQLNIERFDIVELIRNINASSEILLQQNEVKLEFNQENPIYVWGDEFMMEEVYTNYLTNAIHYAPVGGRVSVHLEEKEDHLRVSVFNEGNPIPEEELEKIWIKFYKVDKARTREYGGSGIGLSIVAATMKLHGRDYGAYNKENGVVFYFELELAKQHLSDETC